MKAELVLVPVLLPLLTAGVMLWMGEGRRRTKALLNLVSTAATLAVAIMMMVWVYHQDAAAAFGIYLPGNWPVPFGIVLVADHLSALLAVLAGSLGLATLLYALARWQHAGVYFHVLFQLQLMGLYGAFLTADLFNLFVFFEVLLAASYALLLHGGGSPRVKSGLHYIAINLLASLFFLIGVAVLYGVTGTLNMADMAQKLQAVPASDRGLLHTGAAILAVAFLTKAGLWPLNFWLPGAYSAASAPVAGLFAILTKVGVYALVRLWTLCFPETAGPSAHFGAEVLIWGGVITLAFGAVGMLASQQLARLASYSVIASSGTLIAALGFDQIALSTGALYYLASSTLAGGALFMLVELMERSRQVELGPQQIDDGQDRLPAFFEAAPPVGVNLDDNEDVLIGRAIPGALAFLGVTFGICAAVVAGLPPFSGFVAKLAMLSALPSLNATSAWLLFGLMILSGLMAALAMVRAGIRHFWGAAADNIPKLRLIETVPIGLLLAASVLLVVWGESALRYAHDTADALHNPERYIRAVMSAQPVPSPSAVVEGGRP